MGDFSTWWIALAADPSDLFVLQIHPDNPDQYLLDDQWRDMDVRLEAIQVRGAEPVSLKVRETAFGPVVTEYLEGLKPGEAVAEQRVPLDGVERDTVQAHFGMLRARNADMANGRSIAPAARTTGRGPFPTSCCRKSAIPARDLSSRPTTVRSQPSTRRKRTSHCRREMDMAHATRRGLVSQPPAMARDARQRWPARVAPRLRPCPARRYLAGRPGPAADLLRSHRGGTSPLLIPRRPGMHRGRNRGSGKARRTIGETRDKT